MDLSNLVSDSSNSTLDPSDLVWTLLSHMKNASWKVKIHSKANLNKQDVTQKVCEELLFIAIVFLAKNNKLQAGWNRKRQWELEENKKTKIWKKPKKAKEEVGKCYKVRLHPSKSQKIILAS